MFEVFGRTGPPILGARQFWHTLFSVSYLFSTSGDSWHSNKHTRLLDNNICTVLYNIWKHVAVGAPLRTPPGSLQRPPEYRSPVKHTSLHNRLGVLKCSKTHLQQTRFQKFSAGQTPGPQLLDPPLNTMNRAANCLTPALLPTFRSVEFVLPIVCRRSLTELRVWKFSTILSAPYHFSTNKFNWTVFFACERHVLCLGHQQILRHDDVIQ